MYGTRFNHECRCECIHWMDPGRQQKTLAIQLDIISSLSHRKYVFVDQMIWLDRPFSQNPPVSQCTTQQQWTHMCTFLLQSGAFWNMGLVHYGIYEYDLLGNEIQKIALQLQCTFSFLYSSVSLINGMFFSSHCSCSYSNSIQCCYQFTVSC